MENELMVKDDSLPFRIMDALDDQLIVQELEGRLPEILTYHFNDKGQEIWGLSKAGVDEATGELAKQGEVIRELELTFVDNDKEGFFQVKAGRFVISKDGKEILLDTKFGTKRQPKKTAKGNENTFWYEQGSIKACRNASMRLIPKTIVQAVIENAKKSKKVKEIKQDDLNQEMEEFKKESEKLTSELHDKIVACKSLKELQDTWKTINQNINKLLPENKEMLTQLKNKRKDELNVK